MWLTFGLLALWWIWVASWPSIEDRKKGHEHYKKTVSEFSDRLWEIAKKEDVYYCGNFNIGLNKYFYYDGSLKIDTYTNKRYPKGQYRCDSRGHTCTWEQAPADWPRPKG